MKPDELNQSYFSEPPYKLEFMFDDNHGRFGVATLGCAYFWNNKKFKDEKPGNKSGLGDGI